MFLYNFKITLLYSPWNTASTAALTTYTGITQTVHQQYGTFLHSLVIDGTLINTWSQ